jgi:hypothetical protein
MQQQAFAQRHEIETSSDLLPPSTLRFASSRRPEKIACTTSIRHGLDRHASLEKPDDGPWGDVLLMTPDRDSAVDVLHLRLCFLKGKQGR